MDVLETVIVCGFVGENELEVVGYIRVVRLAYATETWSITEAQETKLKT